ncbi:MAG: hypothetical protein GQ581_06625 [Methyloprofundus sp.]|nr:hypothetical protein [Methyloprofundus sp.]
MTAKILIIRLMDKIFTKLLSLSLLTMPAFVLTVHHGVSIAALPILLLSLIVLKYRYPIDISLNKKEKILIFSLVFLPVVISLDVILRGVSFRYLDYYLRFILVIPVFFALREVQVNLTPLILGIVVGSIGGGLFSLYEIYYLNNLRLMDYVTLGYMAKINFGNISLLLGMMSLAGLFIVNDIRYKKTFYIVTLLAFILGVTGSVLSGARGSWIAIPFFIGLFIMYFPVSRFYKIISVVILIVLMVLTYYSRDYVKSRVDHAYKETAAYYNSDPDAANTPTGTRLELWKVARIMVVEHPLFGIGSGQFKQALKEKIDTGEIKKIHLYSHVHNEPLQILVTTGIIGFLAYLILYVGVAYYFYSSLIASNIKRVRYLSFLGIMTVGAYFIFGLTNYTFGHHVMILFFAVMVAVFAGMISSIEYKIKE